MRPGQPEAGFRRRRCGVKAALLRARAKDFSPLQNAALHRRGKKPFALFAQETKSPSQRNSNPLPVGFRIPFSQELKSPSQRKLNPLPGGFQILFSGDAASPSRRREPPLPAGGSFTSVEDFPPQGAGRQAALRARAPRLCPLKRQSGRRFAGLWTRCAHAAA